MWTHLDKLEMSTVVISSDYKKEDRFENPTGSIVIDCTYMYIPVLEMSALAETESAECSG